MRTLVEFCRQNMPTGTYHVFDELKKNPDADVIEYGCLGQCSRCARNPFVLLEGKVVEAEEARDLLKKIVREI